MAFSGKTVANTFKDLLQIDNSNAGISTSLRVVKDGAGNQASLYISDDQIKIQPERDDTTSLLEINDKDGDQMLLVDSTNDAIKSFGHHLNTKYKEFGLFDFSPTAGYHNPMICNNMMFSDSGSDFIQDTSMFGNGADPATTLDLSANGTPMIAAACYWYLMDDITIDKITCLATADANISVTVHLFSYTLDTSSNQGDLSAGTLLATNALAYALTATTLKPINLTISSADVDSGDVIIAFVENQTDTADMSIQTICKYHLR